MDKSRCELKIASTLVGFAQAVAHWFPWPRLLGRELRPPENYIVGTGLIVTAFGGWALRRERISGKSAFLGLCAVVVASGLPVIAGYWIDRRLARRQEKELWGEWQREAWEGTSGSR